MKDFKHISQRSVFLDTLRGFTVILMIIFHFSFDLDFFLPEGFKPEMAYISMTVPGVVRGPHEHVEQTDYCCFIGPANFKLYLWDARPNSPTYGSKQLLYCGIDSPLAVIVPPGIVHAYKNISSESGIVFNAPDRLYAGKGKNRPVDEIRHEDDVESPFTLG